MVPSESSAGYPSPYSAMPFSGALATPCTTVLPFPAQRFYSCHVTAATLFSYSHPCLLYMFRYSSCASIRRPTRYAESSLRTDRAYMHAGLRTPARSYFLRGRRMVLSCYKRTAYPQCTPRKLCCAAAFKGRFQGSLSVPSTPRRTIPKRDRFHPSSSRLYFHFCAIILPKYQFRADRSILPVHQRPPSVVRPESRVMSLKDWLQR